MALSAHIAEMPVCSIAMLAMQRCAWSRVECMGIALAAVGKVNFLMGASIFINRLVDSSIIYEHQMQEV